MTSAAAGHRIRLRGPWTFARIDGGDDVPGETVVRKHPDDWPAFVGTQPGCVRLSRTFHAPSNLDETETVFVVLTGVRGSGEVRLNGELLGGFTTLQRTCELLLPRPLPFSNELIITVSFDAASPSEPRVGVFEVVSLEIRK